MRLKDKVAVVTGASSGIGRAIAICLALEGAFVIVNYSGNSKGADEAVEAIKKMGGNAKAIQFDVSCFSQVEKAAKEIIKSYGHVDILVNNAGITKDAFIMRMDNEDFDKVIDINLKGTFNTIKCFSRQMFKQKSGKIINMASVIGLIGNAGQANYAASKAGVIALTKSAAKEFSMRGINVNAIAPGYVITKMTEVLSDKIKDEIIDKIPMKRGGNPEEIAKVALFLALEDSNYITGQVINVDGGMVM